ncbi:MAG: hypothetical protein ACTSRE_11895 [Promethearchaeota archaeon]
MPSMDMLIKSTILKFASTSPQVNLDNVAALLEMKPEILIFKLERMIFTGHIQGKINKKERVFIGAGSSQVSTSQTGPPSLSDPTHQYSEGQTEFIKVKTSETSQEDYIKLDLHLGYLGSHVRLVMKIINKSDFPIDEVEVKLEFSKKIEVFRTTPKVEYIKHESGIVARIPAIPQKQDFEVKFYLNPEELGKGKIGGQIKFVNYKDFVRLLMIEEMEYNLTVPNIIPKEIAHESIEQYNSAGYIKKDIRSYGLPDKLNPLTAFNHIFQIIRAQNFKLITKIVEDNKKIAWFFGTTEETLTDILVVGQVQQNKIEFYASSKNEQILSALLTSFSNDLKRRILISSVVRSEKEIYDLFCTECGGTLPYFPKPGEFVECVYCNTKNLVR